MPGHERSPSSTPRVCLALRLETVEVFEILDRDQHRIAIRLDGRLEDDTVRKTAQNAKSAILSLRRTGVTLRGLDFDTMLASCVLDPGRRSHGLDVLALEFLDHTMTSYNEATRRSNGLSYVVEPT